MDNHLVNMKCLCFPVWGVNFFIANKAWFEVFLSKILLRAHESYHVDRHHHELSPPCSGEWYGGSRAYLSKRTEIRTLESISTPAFITASSEWSRRGNSPNVH